MGFSPKTKNRCWVATIHIMNMEKAGLTKEEYETPEILAEFFISKWENSGKDRTAGIVVCESLEGLYHAHMALYGNVTTLKNVATILFDSHVEPQKGGKDQLKAYLLKEGEYAEKGEQVLYSRGLEVIQDNQGQRNDLEEIQELLNAGYTPADIFEVSFAYRKYEKMIKSAYLDKKIKETPLIKEMHNEYHWGRSGSGKTYTYINLCKEFSQEEVYLCNDYSNSSGGFDFYANQPAKIIVLDEFRGNMPYHQLLSMLDVYSRTQLHCRYTNTYALWNRVYICSIHPPEQAYAMMVDDCQRNKDPISQFFRRLDVIVYHYIKDGKYRTYRMHPNEYINANDMVERAKSYEKNLPEIEAKLAKIQKEQELDKPVTQKETPENISLSSEVVYMDF